MEYTCGTCGRTIKLVANWNNYSAGRLLPGYRVARHATDGRQQRNVRRQICGGSGVLVPVTVPA